MRRRLATTPRRYHQLATASLILLTLIVFSGAAVRLTGSGLGCHGWPSCEKGQVVAPLQTHAVIEFTNRAFSGIVALVVIAAGLLAFYRVPPRRDLKILGMMLPLGVVAQAVLGGFTVRGALDYGWVMGHFALSMLILLAAAVLAWRASEDLDGSRRRARATVHGSDGVNGAAAPAPDRTLIRWVRALAGLGALTIFAGTAATAAGPHAGGSPGQKINRLDFDGSGTMDFVIHRHGEIALAFGLASLGVWWLARKREARPTVQRPLTVLCVLLALQGVVGLDQYKTHLPTQLVWVHVGLACAAWLAALWAACAAGSLAPRPARSPPERSSGGPVRTGPPLKFPGN
jgi:heme a synthase